MPEHRHSVWAAFLGLPPVSKNERASSGWGWRAFSSLVTRGIWPHIFVVEQEINGRALRDLKSRGQLLRPIVFVGKEGLSASLIKSLEDALAHHELVKVKFTDLKDQKKALMPLLADKVSARLVLRVGNVAVLYRKKADAQ